MDALLFDLGGTFLRAGIAGTGRTIAQQAKIRIHSIAGGYHPDVIWPQVLGSIVAYVLDHAAEVSSSAPIVLSFPGPVTACGRVLQAPTVAGGSAATFDLASAVREKTSRHVFLLNDMSAAAWRLAEIRPERRFLVVTVSSGIGSKIFDRCHAAGVLDQPAHAGEIGHVVVDDSESAPVCDCGGRGHLGAIASGRAIERKARIRAARNEGEFLRSKAVCEFGATPETLNNEKHLVPALLAGDGWVSQLVTECTRPLARTLLTVAMAAGLERVLVIGGFAQALGSVYIEILRGLACDFCRYDVARNSLDSLFELASGEDETSLEGCAAFLRCAKARA
jgi:C7-cyclitol 7-kinase